MFQIGAQCGLKPDEVLDMSLDMFKAVVQGYWAGYYSRAKKPKSLESVLKKLFKAKERNSDKLYKQKKIDDVDVESFLAKEQIRLSQMK